MSASPQKLIDLMQRLKNQLDAVASNLSKTFYHADREIERFTTEIESLIYEAERVLAQAQRELRACQDDYHIDEEGRRHYTDCSSQEGAVSQAQDRLEQLRRIEYRLYEATERYQKAAYQAQHNVDKVIPSARHWLGERENALKEFEEEQQLLRLASLGLGLGIAAGYFLSNIDRSKIKGSVEPRSSSTHLDSAALSAQANYRALMKTLSRKMKGQWGEYALAEEIQHYQHKVILAHSSSPTRSGYDAATWDEKTQTLHIWEVKNHSVWQGYRRRDVGRIGAWETHRRNGQPLRRAVWNPAAILAQAQQAFPAEVAEQIGQAIVKGNVQWHIRLGPDSDIRVRWLDRIARQLGTDQSSLDVKRYDYATMMKVAEKFGIGR